jgi:hypothetical protein
MYRQMAKAPFCITFSNFKFSGLGCLSLWELLAKPLKYKLPFGKFQRRFQRFSLSVFSAEVQCFRYTLKIELLKDM